MTKEPGGSRHRATSAVSGFLSKPLWTGVGGLAAVAAIAVAFFLAWISGRSSPPRPTGAVSSTVPSSAVARKVAMEGTLGAAIVTGGGLQYTGHVDAGPGAEVQLQGWYYNREEVDSGLYVGNLTVKFVVSNTRSTDQVATVYFTGSNTDGAMASATVTVPRGHVLQFVPGSAIWRHNTTQDDRSPRWVNTSLADEIVGAGVRLTDAGPCLMCEATVIVRARVVAA